MSRREYIRLSVYEEENAMDATSDLKAAVMEKYGSAAQGVAQAGSVASCLRTWSALLRPHHS